MADHILITRAQDQAQDFAKDLQALGFETVISPLLKIIPQDWKAFDPKPHALIATSANAMTHVGVGIHDLLHLPLHAVGAQTAQAAREAGFQNIHYKDGGTVDDLINQLGNHTSLGYLRGVDITRDLKAELGDKLQERITYNAVEADKLSDESFTAVTLFSTRTAEVFYDLYVPKDSPIKILCISDAVLEYVRTRIQHMDPAPQLFAAKVPDRAGMIALIKAQCHPKTEHVREGQKMSDNAAKPIQNAEDIIERFGGIRPMAKKINVAVTTIQGWKKRNVIPANRLDQILSAAAQYNVDLQGLVQNAPPANQNATPPPVEKPVAAHKSKEAPKASRPAAPADKSHDEILAQMAEMEKKMMTQSMMATVILILIGFAVALFLLWPSSEPATPVIQTPPPEQQSRSFTDFLPEELRADIENLREQADQVTAQVQQTAQQVQETAQVVGQVTAAIQTDVLAEDAGTFEERAAALATQVETLTGSPEMQALFERLQNWNGTPDEVQMDRAVIEINDAMQTQPEGSSLDVNAILDQARAQSAALGQTFEGVPTRELQAAGLLLGFTQVRSALNRDQQPFDQDLQLLMNLIGEDNTALRAQIETLAPHAQSGVLTPAGLNNEFRTLAGDAVVASLQGEDVSIRDRASARVNELLQVEKDGELITGTPTQQTLNTAQNHLNDGDLAAAITAAQSLQGPEAALLAPWLEKAKATLAAQNLQSSLGQVLSGQGIGGLTTGTAGGTLIMNEETGIRILAPNDITRNMP